MPAKNKTEHGNITTCIVKSMGKSYTFKDGQVSLFPNGTMVVRQNNQIDGNVLGVFAQGKWDNLVVEVDHASKDS